MAGGVLIAQKCPVGPALPRRPRLRGWEMCRQSTADQSGEARQHPFGQPGQHVPARSLAGSLRPALCARRSDDNEAGWSEVASVDPAESGCGARGREPSNHQLGPLRSPK